MLITTATATPEASRGPSHQTEGRPLRSIATEWLAAAMGATHGVGSKATANGVRGAAKLACGSVDWSM